jgi:peptidyl-prolyl cis-trans isomerase C
MHKKIFSHIFLISILFLFPGCSKQSEKKEVVAYVGPYETTVEDFNAYREKAISISLPLTLQQKTKLLDNLIDRQLLIQEAVKEGLDKKEDFMKEIEDYWHQSLIKRIVDKKSKEIVSNVKIYRREMEAYYRDVIGKQISAFVLFLNSAGEAQAVSGLKKEDEIRLYINRKPAALVDSKEGQIQPQDLPFSFTQEIYSRQAGEFTRPVRIASNLWMLGYVKSKADNGPAPEFSKVEGQIETAIRRQKELEGMEAWLSELRSNKKIIVNKDILSRIK